MGDEVEQLVLSLIVNGPGDRLWESWARSMRARGLSPTTIEPRSYVFRRWVDEIGADRVLDASHRDLERFLGSAATWAPETRRRAYGDIGAFYRFARREGLTGADPVGLADPPARRRATPRPASESEVACALDGGRLDDRRAVALMAFGGLRCVEVSRLRGADLDVGGGLLFVEGKGGHRRAVWITAPLGAWLAQVDGIDADAPIYPGRLGDPVTGRTVCRRVSQHCASLGLQGVTGHRFRHYFASRLYRASHDLGVVRDQLGHASTATTEGYAALSSDVVREAVAAF